MHKCTRRCNASGRDLQEGESCYSVLVAQGAQVDRIDFAEDAWQGPPQGAIGWWKSKIPTRETRRARMAPNDVLLELFEELSGHPEKADMQYVLALLLVRRRVFRIEEGTGEQGKNEQAAESGEVLTLYCARDDKTYQVHCAPPDAVRTDEIQAELNRLLYSQ